MNIFSSDSLLGRFLNFTADLLVLNILWLIFSLPLITIGASTTALYYSMMIRIRKDEGYLHTNFIKSFRQNFKQSTLLWLLVLLIGAILWTDYRIGLYFSMENVSMVGGNFIGKFMIFTSILLSIPYLLTLIYLFPVQAKFENSLLNNIKNALLMAIAHFGYTMIVLFFFCSFILLSLISRAFLGVVVLFGASLYAYLTGNIFITVFRKHLPDELEQDIEASGIDKLNN